MEFTAQRASMLNKTFKFGKTNKHAKQRKKERKCYHLGWVFVSISFLKFRRNTEFSKLFPALNWNMESKTRTVEQVNKKLNFATNQHDLGL